MSPIPDDIEPGTHITMECSVKHTCPSHPPSITWSVPTAQEAVKHQSMGEGVWKTVSTVTFIPTGYEEEDQIICNAAFWGDRTEVNSSAKLSIQSKFRCKTFSGYFHLFSCLMISVNMLSSGIQGVGVEVLGPSIIVPILIFLLLCAGVIMYKRQHK